jgi:hypothetical protein
MTTMRAKMEVREVGCPLPLNQLKLTMVAVCGQNPFGPDGESDDNTYSRWTPTSTLEMYITNPNLVDKFKVGQKFYVDFTEAQ